MFDCSIYEIFVSWLLLFVPKYSVLVYDDDDQKFLDTGFVFWSLITYRDFKD